MNNDDVLAQLRAWRDGFARSHGYDIHRVAAALRELDVASGQKLVRGEPRSPATKAPSKPLQPSTAIPAAMPSIAEPTSDG
jgi:hypothetical protein